MPVNVSTVTVTDMYKVLLTLIIGLLKLCVKEILLILNCINPVSGLS